MYGSDFHGVGTFYVFCSVSEEPVEFLSNFENEVNEKIEECFQSYVYWHEVPEQYSVDWDQNYRWRMIPEIGGADVRYMAYFPEISIMLIYENYGTYQGGWITKVFRKFLFATVMLMIPICALPLTGFASVPDHANEAGEAPADTESIDQGIEEMKAN